MKSGLTLTVTFVLFLGSIVLGFQLLTAPSNVSADPAPTCENRSFKAGDELAANQIRISSLNASQRSGLANRALIDLQRRGFAPGTISNAPEDVKARSVKILTTDPKHPAVQLVAKQFDNKVKFGDPVDPDQEGIMIVLGKHYKGLKKNPPRKIKITEPLDWCVPVLSETE